MRPPNRQPALEPSRRDGRLAPRNSSRQPTGGTTTPSLRHLIFCTTPCRQEPQQHAQPLKLRHLDLQAFSFSLFSRLCGLDCLSTYQLPRLLTHHL